MSRKVTVLGSTGSIGRQSLEVIAACGMEAAALAALKEDAYARWTARETASLRKELAAGLSGLGFRVYPSAANYLLFRRRDGTDYAAYLRERGILIRSCANYPGLSEGYYRVSVRKQEENAALLACLKEAAGR